MKLVTLFDVGDFSLISLKRIQPKTRRLAARHMRHIPENTPVFLIRDDMAALHGCLEALGPAG